MIVDEIISLAQNSELKQLAVKDEPAAIRGYLNLAILEIHKRFALLQQKAVINMVTGINEYLLDNNDINVELNLKGNQYLTVDEVYDAEGNWVAINREKDPDSVKTPAHNIIEIPDTILVPGESLHLVYRAAPAFLVHGSDTIPLPPQFVEPLLNYIGYRGHGSLQGGKQFENNTHYMRFENSCNQIKASGLFIGNSLDTNKFENRGFV